MTQKMESRESEWKPIFSTEIIFMVEFHSQPGTQFHNSPPSSPKSLHNVPSYYERTGVGNRKGRGWWVKREMEGTHG